MRKQSSLATWCVWRQQLGGCFIAWLPDVRTWSRLLRNAPDLLPYGAKMAWQLQAVWLHVTAQEASGRRNKSLSKTGKHLQKPPAQLQLQGRVASHTLPQAKQIAGQSGGVTSVTFGPRRISVVKENCKVTTCFYYLISQLSSSSESRECKWGCKCLGLPGRVLCEVSPSQVLMQNKDTAESKLGLYHGEDIWK